MQTLATGQIYTATQAKENGLIDEIAYLDTVIDDLKASAGLDQARVVTYQKHSTLIDLVLNNLKSRETTDPVSRLLEASVPRAMYLASWPAAPED